jgi:hypothetical protein
MRDRDNICVICDGKDKLYGYNVINQSFKRYFPLEHKNHNNELVFLVCRECHPDTDYYNGLYIKAIFNEYKETPDDQPLFYCLILVLILFYEIKKYQSSKLNSKIIKKVVDNNKIKEFEDGFLKHFLKYLEPQFIPDDVLERVKPLLEELKQKID